MESAVESGKMASKEMAGGIHIIKHRYNYLHPFIKIDNLLYSVGLPSIVDIILKGITILNVK